MKSELNNGTEKAGYRQRTIIEMATEWVVLSEHAAKAYYAAIESGKALPRYQFKRLPHRGGT